jgi:fatty-acyl-CoA synthase
MNPAAVPGLRDRAPDWLERLSALWPDRVSITDPDTGTGYTYGELRARSEAVAGELDRLGVSRGDRVVLLLENGVEVLDLLFACGRLGAILVPLNWRLAAREIGELMPDAQPSLVVADQEYVELARSTAPDVPLVILPEDRHAFLNGLATSTEPPPRADVRMDDPWLILYTGGTTGMPKGAVLTHASILWNAINTAVSWGLSEADVAPSFTPMFHTGGLNVFTLPLLMLGGRVILPRRFEPAQALRILEEERPTVMFMVPTMFALVAEQPGFEAADLSHLRWAISGGAPLSRETARPWKAKVRLFKQGYGLTEVGPNNFATSDADAARGMDHTVGKLTMFARARIVDDERVDAPDGTVGELLLAGPHMCAGYWRQPEATAAAFHDGWFATGDLACRDAQGFFRIVDRKKDMIISGGENVYPTEVEAVLYMHPSVREVAVVGVPDARWGQAVHAVVSLRPGQTTSEEELRAFCRENLARYKTPKVIEIVPDLPKSAAGKILRAEARKLLRTRSI